jgi:ferrous iron transport protein B
MMDLAKKRQINIDINALASALNIPVVETIAVETEGVDALLRQLEILAQSLDGTDNAPPVATALTRSPEIQLAVNALIAACVQQVKDAGKEDAPLSYRIDRWILHPVFGPADFCQSHVFGISGCVCLGAVTDGID